MERRIEMETPADYQADDKTIFRKPHNREHPYVVISKTIFEDDAISWKAKGLMGYLLSRPDDWTVRLGDLVKRSTDGRSAVRSALKELEERGYLIKNILRDEHGHWAGIEMIVSEHPQQSEPVAACDFPTADNPTSENPQAGNPTADNRTLLSTDPVLSTDFLPNIEGTKEEPPAADPPPSAQKRLERMRSKLGADPFSVAVHCEQERAKVEHPDFADPSMDVDEWYVPFRVFCIAFLPGVDVDRMPKQQRAQIEREIQRLAMEVQATPQRAAEAIRDLAHLEAWLVGPSATPYNTRWAEGFQNTLIGDPRLIDAQIASKGKQNGHAPAKQRVRDAPALVLS